MIDRFLDRVPRTALYAYGIRRWCSAWARTVLGLLDPE